MSTSLLKKSLRLFEDEGKAGKQANKKQAVKEKRGANKSSIVKKQATLKDRKVKSAIQTFVKKNPKKDRTLENLAVLDKLSKKPSVSKESAHKIFSYQLEKQRKFIEKPVEKKKETTVFTEEDFRKFESEYFVKVKH